MLVGAAVDGVFTTAMRLYKQMNSKNWVRLYSYHNCLTIPRARGDGVHGAEYACVNAWICQRTPFYRFVDSHVPLLLCVFPIDCRGSSARQKLREWRF